MPKGEEKTEAAEAENDQTIILFGHGNKDRDANDCEFLTLAADETITSLFIRYNSTQGVNILRIETSKGQNVMKGVFQPDDVFKKITFDE